MAEFCLECWNKINGTDDPPEKYVLSEKLDLCEGCGQMKQVVVMERKDDDFGLSFLLFWPIQLIAWVVCFPYKIYRYYKKKKP